MDLAPASKRVKSGSAPRNAEAPANQAFLGDWCNGNMGVSKTLARGSIPRSPVRDSGRRSCRCLRLRTGRCGAPTVGVPQQMSSASPAASAVGPSTSGQLTGNVLLVPGRDAELVEQSVAQADASSP